MFIVIHFFMWEMSYIKMKIMRKEVAQEVNKYRFLWLYYTFYDYIYGVCSEVNQENENLARTMTVESIKKVYYNMDNSATKDEITRYVNQLMIEIATEFWKKQQKEKKQQEMEWDS